MKPTRILSIHFPSFPSPEPLPEFATLLLSLSPRVGIRPPDLLYVDLTPTAHLFPDEAAVVERIRGFLRAKGIRGSIAMADDVATAGALAHHAPGIVPRGESEKALAPLPIGSLLFLAAPLSPPSQETTREVTAAVELLSFLGIRTLGGFARLPASTIPTRFGPLGAELHRRARGAESLLLRPFEPSVTYRERETFEEPIASLEPLLFLLKGALSRLEQKTKRDASGALSISLFFETEQAQELEVEIPLARPIRNARGLFGVIREKLSRFTIPAPLLSMAVEISTAVRVRGSQFHLFDAGVGQQEPLDELLGRLMTGLGPTVVSAAELRERHRPERSWEGIPFDPLSKPEGKKISFLAPRPTLLLSQPEPIRSDGITSMGGPERIEGEWWDGEGHARDYFVAKNRAGQLLWIFRDRKSRGLFLHGYFD